MIALNEITGVLALALMLLVCRGFAPHMRLRGSDPVTFLMQGIFIGSAIIGMRICTYDIVVPLLRYFEVMGGGPRPMYAATLNTIFNTGFSIGAWRVLAGLHASLPDEDRGRYSWLTAPFYPKTIRIFRRKE